MICTNFVKRKMRYLSWYRAAFTLAGSTLEITREDQLLIQIELSEDDRRQLIIALGGWYQPDLFEEQPHAT